MLDNKDNKCCELFFTRNQVRLMNNFRVLWEQHDIWTRETINGIVFCLPNLQLVVTRLLRNPVDMARFFRIFYGQRVAIRIRELFTEHLVIAAELVKAAKARNTEAVINIRRRWYHNAKNIARFLSMINPFWVFGRWFMLLKHHLRLVEAEAVLLLRGKFEENIAIYDEIERQSLVMADEMSGGIIKQFCFS